MDFDPLLGLDRAHLFEHGQRLSESVLWDLQAQYYEDNPDAFSDGTIPMYATSNAFVARTYARLIEAFAADHPEQPVTVLELGAGHGRFGFLCLSTLLRRGNTQVRYILSDATGHCTERWAAHPRLKPLIANKHLDLARFDANHDESVQFSTSEDTLSPEQRCGPLVIIANYVFDSLIQEAFRIKKGALELGRVSLISEQPDATADTPGLLGSLAVSFSFTPVDAAVYDDDRDKILAYYAENLGDQSFSLPVGTMQCLERLRALSAGPTLVLSLDKAHNHLAGLQASASIHVETHGSVSMTVNHDALGRFAVNGGGSALLSSPRSGYLESAALVLGALAGPRLTSAFNDTIEYFSPSDYLELYAHSHPEKMSSCLKLLRLSGWDPHWMRTMTPTLLNILPNASVEQRNELRGGLNTSTTLTFSIGVPSLPDLLDVLREALLAG